MSDTRLSLGWTRFTDSFVGRLVLGIGGPILVAIVFYSSFLFMRDAEAPRLAIAVVALVVGVGGVWLLFYALNSLVEVLQLLLMAIYHYRVLQ